MAGRLGIGVALRYALDIGMQAIEERVLHLARELRDRLRTERRVSVVDLGRTERQCGIVSFTVAGVDAAVVKQGLRAEGVYVSTSSAGSTPLDAEDRSLPTVVSGSACISSSYGVCDDKVVRIVQLVVGWRLDSPK